MIILNSLLMNCYELIKIDPTVQLQTKEEGAGLKSLKRVSDSSLPKRVKDVFGVEKATTRGVSCATPTATKKKG